MNIFRFIADMLHLAAILTLLYRIKVSRNVTGKSPAKPASCDPRPPQHFISSKRVNANICKNVRMKKWHTVHDLTANLSLLSVPCRASLWSQQRGGNARGSEVVKDEVGVRMEAGHLPDTCHWYNKSTFF